MLDVHPCSAVTRTQGEPSRRFDSTTRSTAAPSTPSTATHSPESVASVALSSVSKGEGFAAPSSSTACGSTRPCFVTHEKGFPSKAGSAW